MAEKDPAESGRRLHVTTLLVASRRALDNALAELGFPEDDDRVVEHDGRLAFLTCSHEEDCDDMFALISELSSRGESWELQSRIDAEAGRAIYQSFARYRPVEAVDAAVEDEPEPDTADSPLHDVETAEGLQALRSELLAMFQRLEASSGPRILDVHTPRIEPVNDRLALVIPYIRAGAKGAAPWEVTQYKIPVSGRLVEMTLSHRQSDAGEWKPLLEHARRSLRF